MRRKDLSLYGKDEKYRIFFSYPLSYQNPTSLAPYREYVTYVIVKLYIVFVDVSYFSFLFDFAIVSI